MNTCACTLNRGLTSLSYSPSPSYTPSPPPSYTPSPLPSYTSLGVFRRGAFPLPLGLIVLYMPKVSQLSSCHPLLFSKFHFSPKSSTVHSVPTPSPPSSPPSYTPSSDVLFGYTHCKNLTFTSPLISPLVGNCVSVSRRSSDMNFPTNGEVWWIPPHTTCPRITRGRGWAASWLSNSWQRNTSRFNGHSSSLLWLARGLGIYFCNAKGKCFALSKLFTFALSARFCNHSTKTTSFLTPFQTFI